MIGLRLLEKRLEEAYDLRSCQIVPLEKGRSNRHFVVFSLEDTYICRRYATPGDTVWNMRKRSVASILYEHRVLEIAAQNGFPCDAPLQTTSGKTLLSLAGHHYCLFPYTRAESVVDPRTAGPAAVSLLATFHRIMMEEGAPRIQRQSWGDRCRLPVWFPTHHAAGGELSWWIDWARRLPRDNPNHARIASGTVHLDRACRIISERYSALDRPSFPRVVIHGDFGPNNVGLGEDRVMHVFDFDDCSLDLRVFDLATAVSLFAGNNMVNIHRETAHALVRAYREELEMDAEELSLVPTMMIARSLYYAMNMLVAIARRPDVSGRMPLHLFLDALEWQLDNQETLGRLFGEM